MDGNDLSPKNWSGASKLTAINLVVTILLAIMTGMSKLQLDAADIKLKNLDAQLKPQAEVRADRESIEKKQFAVYDAVVTSIEKQDKQRQKVAKALVQAMLDEPLRTELLVVFEAEGVPEIQQLARSTLKTESAFKAEETVVASTAATTGSSKFEDYNFDVFWCEQSGQDAREIAEKIRAQLASRGVRGRVRVRMLPDSINSKAGYQHNGFVVRYNDGEDGQAQLLKELADKAAGGGSFQLSLSRQSTPSYVSCFVCQGAR